MPFYTMPDGEKLFVREIGQGKPVLILSGLGMSSWQWLAYILPSLKKRRFLIPDYRGFGQSKHCKIPQDISAIESHWQDIRALIAQLNLEAFDVIGYSMGATTTMHGLKYGDFEQYIDKYLHIDQTAKIRNSENDWNFGLYGDKQKQCLEILQNIYDFLNTQRKYEYIQQLPSAEKQQFSHLWMEFIYFQADQPLLKKLAQYDFFHNLHPRLLPLQRIDYMLWYLNTYLQHDEDYRQTLMQLKCPTEFIIGQQSTLYASQGQLAIAQQIPQAKIHMMAKSGHVPLMREPVKFGKIFNQFLK